MKAAYINELGGPEKIIYGELPAPEPGANQCLVRVAAVDVNPYDLYVRSGAVAANLKFPHILGQNLAGEIVATGPNAKRFKPGDRVWAIGQGERGTFAELAAVAESALHPIPAGVSAETAVALSLVGVTAQLGLMLARIQAGEILFVNGGSGGVGSSVVQMAKILGARVITTAGSEAKSPRAGGSARIAPSTTKLRTWPPP